MKYSAHILDALADSLCNDEYSSDEELIEWFIGEYGLSQAEANAVVALRLPFLNTIPTYQKDSRVILQHAINKANGIDQTVEGNHNTSRNMKTSKLNYFEEYAKLNTDQLSDNIRKVHKIIADKSKEGKDWSAITANATFSEMAERQFKILDMIKQKVANSAPAPKAEKQPKSRKTTSSKKEKNKVVESRTTSSSSEAVRRVHKTTAKLPAGSPVETVDPNLVILARYLRMDGKAIPRERVVGLARTLVKQIEARMLRKASMYSHLIEQMRKQLFKPINTSKGANIRIAIPPQTKNAIIKALGDEHQMKSVQLLRRYAGMAGKHTTIDKAKRLYNAMVAAVEKEQIPQSDRYFERVIEVMRHIKAYVEKKDERKQMALLPAELSGVLGCACEPDELNGLEDDDDWEEQRHENTDREIAVEPYRGKSGIVPVNSLEFMKRKFPVYHIAEPWVKVFGHIEPGKHIVVYSKEKLGKTTALVEFAGYLSAHHGPVLFVQKEEELSGTFQDKIEKTQAANPNLDLLEELPDDEKLSEYRFVFLDSVTRLKMNPDQLLELQRRLSPDVTFIAVLHANKRGQHRGANTFVQDASQIVEFPEFATAQGRGRFKGTTGEMIRFTDQRE